ncbi:MAG: TetR/AcrR family transcriptional regulator [Haliea sp.]
MDAAAVKFREKGFSGIGVDAIASHADVTTGAIYSQFQSKDALFYEVTEEGLQRLAAGLERFKESKSEDWIAQFATYYLSKEHVEAVGTGCGLPTLSIDVGRADKSAQQAFNEGLHQAASVISTDSEEQKKAMLVLATLLGAVVLARATGNDQLRRDLLEAFLHSLDT